jgi:quinol monooxygenase YgiN
LLGGRRHIGFMASRRQIMRVPFVCAYVIASVSLYGWTGTVSAQTADEPIVQVAKFYPTLGRENELQERLLKLVEFVRKAEPKTVYRLHRSTKEPVVFLWYEVYESKAALEHHRTVVLPAFRKEYGPLPEGIVVRPAEVESYRDISK